ncbi:MAG: prolyl oligopeptidase family serine peptidase [Myxococcota bacterium]
MRAPLLALSLILSCTKPAPPPPPPMVEVAAAEPAKPAIPAVPEARREAVADTLHGVVVADPYRWLEDEKSPEVQAWMKAEDDHARARLAALPAREKLAARFKELYYVDSVNPPVQRAGRYFYLKTHADEEKAILYWREGSEGAEKVLLDPNQWSKDGTVSLGYWMPSWDGKRIVYAEKPNAADEATLKVVEVDTGAVSTTDVIPGAKYADPDWTPDGSGFYYEWIPSDPAIPVDQRPGHCELRYHQLGTDPAKDPTVHPKTGDASTFLSGWLSRDGRFLFVGIYRGWNENDVWVKDLKKDKEFKAFALGKDALYGVTEWDGWFYVQTDEGAPKGRVFRTKVDKRDRKSWVEIVKEDPSARIESFGIVGGKLAINYLKDASSQLRITTLDGKPVREIALPTIGTTSSLHGLEDQDDAYFQFSSYTVPKQVYKTSIATGEVSLWAKVELPVDTSRYVVEQVRFPSKDGTQIPMFLVHRKDLPKDGTNPTLLYGYGGFDVALTPNFRSSIYPWLEAGGVYAVANLRGGGEYGKDWHDAGRMDKKQNVFDDFAAAGEYLVREGWTKPEKLAINGGSNGGLLMGAAMTQRPDLWAAVVCAVPLLDMVRYHQFGSGRTWIPEYGSAEDPKQFATLHAYSPYHHVKEGTAYPALLMLAADHDDRVDPMHARKFVAAVRHATTNKEVLLRIEANAGHGGADQVAKAIEYSADMYAFLFDRLGVKLAE